MKKRVVLSFSAFLLVGNMAFAVGCSSPSSPSASSDVANDSLVAFHSDFGTNISDLTEVSEASCTESGCHGGSYAAVRETTEGLWAGIGQIGDANPHDSHGSSGFVCENCHNLSDGASVNECNQCHAFDSPEGWDDKAADTTQYGLVTEQPLY